MCKCLYKKNKCCCNILIKRCFLPFTAVIFLFFYEEVRNAIYLPLIMTFVFFILFWNFPFIVYHTASKPLYYEDLFIDEKKLPNYEVEETIKAKFQCILQWVLIITNSLLVGSLSEYWFYKLNKDKIYNWIEIIGVTGGIIKIFQIANNTIVKVMLKILRHYVKQESTQYKLNQIDTIKDIIQLKIRSPDRENKITEMTDMYASE